MGSYIKTSKNIYKNEWKKWVGIFFQIKLLSSKWSSPKMLSTNMKEVEPYDLPFENHMQCKKKCSKNNLIMHVCQQVDEHVPYEKIA